MPRANVNGTMIHYHDQGRGVPIIFIHPPLITQHLFKYQQVSLSQTYRIITYDLRGHGMSASSDKPLSYALLVEDLKQLMNHLQIEQAYLCGYSVSSQLVISAMLTHPDRFLGMILLSGFANLKGKTRLLMKCGQTATRYGWKKLSSYLVALGNADLKYTFDHLYAKSMQGNVENWNQYCLASLKFDREHEISSIHKPALLIYGENDRNLWKNASLFQQRMKDVTLATVANSPHHLPTKASLLINDWIEQWIEDQQEKVTQNTQENVIAYKNVKADESESIEGTVPK